MAGKITKSIQARAAITSNPAVGKAIDFVDSTTDPLGVPALLRSDGSVVSAVTTVTGTAPISSTGGTTPAISISPATGSNAGSISAADQTKLNSVTSGAAVATVTGTAPIVSSGGTSPAISLTTSPAGQTPVGVTRNIATTAPLTGGGTLAADLTLALSAASASAAGSLSASFFNFINSTQFGTFNVKAYGATGDGSTDDTAAVQAAYTAATGFTAGAAGQRGAVVAYPPGVYKLTAAITLASANGIVSAGYGRGPATLLVNFASGDLFALPASSEFWEFRSLQFFAGVTRTSGAFINTNGANDVIIDRFAMSGAFTGINVSGASIKVTVTNGTIDSTVAATGVGILVANGAAGDTYLGPRLIFSNSAGARPLADIRIQQTGHCQIDGVNATSGVSGLLIDPSTSQDVSYVFCSNSLFDSCGTNGLLVNPANVASARVRSLKFVNAWFSGSSSAAGAFLSSQGASAVVDDVEFVECRFLNNGTHGLQHAFGTNVRVNGGTVAGNSAASSGVSDGINIAAAISDWSVTSCKLGTAGTATSTSQRYGLAVTAGASNRYSITSNDFTGNVTGGFLDSGTGTNKVVADNVGGAVGSLPITATTAGLNTTETVVNLTPTGLAGLQVGTTYRLTAFGTCTSSAANASTFTLRYGTAGTTADASIATFAVTAAATGTAIPFKVEIIFTVRALGTTSTIVGGAVVNSQGLATGTSSGIAAFSVDTFALTATATLNTALNGILSLTYKSAATTTTATFTTAFIEVVKA